jgi:hypothetical protein
LIVHSNEQPYHCCSCEFKSKWKSDVKKHQRSHNHIGPILVGKKAMQKVIENLGLDKSSMVSLYGPQIQVIDNKQCKSNEKLIDEDMLVRRPAISSSLPTHSAQKRKRDAADDDEEEYGVADDDGFEQLDDEEYIDEENYDEPIDSTDMYNEENYENEHENDEHENEQLEIDQDVDAY